MLHVRPEIKNQKFKKTEIISSYLSDHSGMKLEIQKEKWDKNKHMETKQHATEKLNGSTMK